MRVHHSLTALSPRTLRRAAALAAILLVGVSRSLSAQNAACLDCHEMPNLGFRDSAAVVRHFSVRADAFARSVHAKLSCTQCHAGTASYPHDPARSPASCDGDCHATDRAGRPYTHAQQARDLAHSVHGGRAGRDLPTCLTCHGNGDPHAVTRLTGASPAVRMAACVDCHESQRTMARHRVSAEAVVSYQRSFHYKAIRFGDTHTAGCPDCHTAHGVLPASDSGSTVAAGNLTHTCGKSTCHEGAWLNFASSGASHLDLRVAREPILWLEEKLFFLLTAGTMAMLVVGIVLDVQKKFGWMVLARRGWRAAGPPARAVLAFTTSRWVRLRAALTLSRNVTLRVARLLLYD